MAENAKQSKWPLLISILILSAAVASYYFIPSVHESVNRGYDTLTSGDEARISEWVGRLGFWGPLVIIAAMIVQIFLLVVPSPLLMVVAVLAYGPTWGAVISVVAVFFASSIGYFIGRYLGVVTIYRLIGEKKEKQMEFYIERYGFWAVFITRLSPLLSNDAISLVSGILRMNYWKFIAATVGGITPLAVLIAYFGENNDRLKSGLIWTTVISAAFFAGYIIYDRRKNKGKPNEK